MPKQNKFLQMKCTLIFAAAALSLAACATPEPVVATNSTCIEFGPITPTARDWQIMSGHLKSQITDYDAAWDSLCSKNPIE
jgi:hypothetical protein